MSLSTGRLLKASSHSQAGLTEYFLRFHSRNVCFVPDALRIIYSDFHRSDPKPPDYFRLDHHFPSVKSPSGSGTLGPQFMARSSCIALLSGSAADDQILSSSGWTERNSCRQGVDSARVSPGIAGAETWSKAFYLAKMHCEGSTS